MSTHHRELFYVSIFAAALVFVGWIGVQLLLRYQAPFSSSDQTACQLVVYQSTQSSRMALATLVSGTLAILLLKILASIGLYRQLSASLIARRHTQLPSKLRQLCALHGINPANVVLFADPQCAAFTVGTLAPKLVLSTGLVRQLRRSELEAVLLHEQHHAQHHHPLIILLATTTAKALFFIPLLSDLAKHMRDEFEYHADLAAVRAQHTTRYLQQAMAAVLMHPPTTLIPVAAFVPENLQVRLSSLHTKTRPHFRSARYNIFVTALVLVAALLLARPARAQTVNAPSQGPSCGFLRCVSACMQETIALATTSRASSSPHGTFTPVTDHSGSF